MIGKLPPPLKMLSGRLPPPPTNPTPVIWVRVWARVRVEREGKKVLAEFPFFHAECINLMSQQELRLFINDNNFFRRAIVNNCTCKRDFRKSDFLQRSGFLEYL